MKRHVLLIGAFAAVAVLPGCNSDITGVGPPSDPATETFAASLAVDIASMTKTKEGVYYKDLVVGTGATVNDSAVTINVTYAGFLKDGKLFDSGTNVAFGLNDVVPGFRIGLLGMKESGKRKIVIPSELGYGPINKKDINGKITIPRQSTLIFDVEVLKVTKPTSPAT